MVLIWLATEQVTADGDPSQQQSLSDKLAAIEKLLDSQSK
jgi:hypothetical protein